MSAQTQTPAGGSFYVILTITDNSTQSCTTGGYPGVAVENGSGKQIFQAKRSGSKYKPITLTKGQSASTTLTGAEHRQPGGTDCPEYNSLLVTPPDTTRSTSIRVQIFACVAPRINVLVRGTSGGL